MSKAFEWDASAVVGDQSDDTDSRFRKPYIRAAVAAAATMFNIGGISKEASALTEEPSLRSGVHGVLEPRIQDVESAHDSYDGNEVALPSPDKWLKVVDYSGPDGYIKVFLGSTSPIDDDPYADVNTPYIFSILNGSGNWIDLTPDDITRVKSGQMVNVRTRSGTTLTPITVNFTDTIFGTDAEDRFGVAGTCRDGRILGRFTAANVAGVIPTLNLNAYYALFEPTNGSSGTVMVNTSLVEDGRQKDTDFKIEPGAYEYNVYGTDKPVKSPDEIAQFGCDEDGNGPATVTYTVPEDGASLDKPVVKPSILDLDFVGGNCDSPKKKVKLTMISDKGSVIKVFAKGPHRAGKGAKKEVVKKFKLLDGSPAIYTKRFKVDPYKDISVKFKDENGDLRKPLDQGKDNPLEGCEV